MLKLVQAPIKKYAAIVDKTFIYAKFSEQPLGTNTFHATPSLRIHPLPSSPGSLPHGWIENSLHHKRESPTKADDAQVPEYISGTIIWPKP